MVTTVDPLVVLYCSMLLVSMLFRSTLGRWKPFSEGGLELAKLPDTELMPRLPIGMLLWTVHDDIFF